MTAAAAHKQSGSDTGTVGTCTWYSRESADGQAQAPAARDLSTLARGTHVHRQLARHQQHAIYRHLHVLRTRISNSSPRRMRTAAMRRGTTSCTRCSTSSYTRPNLQAGLIRHQAKQQQQASARPTNSRSRCRPAVATRM
jgi:hypothetical protein